jgi:hypothetical protein
MDVEAQIEITEDANQYLTPKLLRDAFRMSIPDIGKGVHKVLIDEEWIEAEDKDGKKIEVLAAVARVYPSAVWVLNNPDDIQEFLTTKNPAPRLNRATPQTASKARDAKKAGKK